MTRETLSRRDFVRGLGAGAVLLAAAATPDGEAVAAEPTAGAPAPRPAAAGQVRFGVVALRQEVVPGGRRHRMGREREGRDPPAAPRSQRLDILVAHRQAVVAQELARLDAVEAQLRGAQLAELVVQSQALQTERRVGAGYDDEVQIGSDVRHRHPVGHS